MKAKTTMKLLLLFCFLNSITYVKAQQLRCQATKVDMKAYLKMVELERSNKNLVPVGPIVIRVFFRVCEPDGGASSGDITEDQINTSFKHLVGAYAADNICFINAGYDYINSSALDT